MKKLLTMACCLYFGSLFFVVFNASAEEKTENNSAMKEQLQTANDITKETIVGPGSIPVNTAKDILMSFGGMIRVIPTSETDWDFGLGGTAEDGFISGNLGSNFFKVHPNESGWVSNGYIRNENRLYFNALPKDRKWSFYAALEYDSAWETSSADSRGGKTSEYNTFGLERLHGSMELPYNMRIHAGFDIWNLDIFEGGGLVYGDDNPGLWVTGDYGTIDFNIGYFKLIENDVQTGPGKVNPSSDNDRDMFAGYLTWDINETNKVKFLYAYDRIRQVLVTDLLGALSNGAFGIQTGDESEIDSHHMGLCSTSMIGPLELFLEGVYQFGSADDTGLSALGKSEDYDISAYALAADVSFEFKGMLTGFPMKPHLGIVSTSGDSDPNDDKLGGYNGIVNAQRFSSHWGGENTIAGDTNWVLGSVLYGYLPELYGNGTPVATGGLSNFSGMGNGRGDNPGLTMVSLGLTMAPKPIFIYKTNINSFIWNEDFEVANFVNPSLGYFKVEAGYVGTEWDNELTWVLSKNTFIKGHASAFFPGSGVKDATSALSGGEESNDTAYRLAMELIWNF